MFTNSIPFSSHHVCLFDICTLGLHRKSLKGLLFLRFVNVLIVLSHIGFAMAYIFVTLPLKDDKGVTQNGQIGVDIPPSEIKMLEKKRIECLHVFDNAKKQPADSLRLESEFILKMVEYVDLYVSALINMVKLYPSFAVKMYYTWASPLGESQCIAYDDYRYELVAIYYNLAAYFVNMAQHLSVQANVGSASRYEKDSYRGLLRAAGYFALAHNVLNDMKLQRIGVAEMPFVLDNVIDLFCFLETLSLAQAQEIGTTRSLQADSKQSSDLSTRLCHQLFLLYKQCKEISCRIGSSSKHFLMISTLCEIKIDVFSVLTYNYAASWAFSSSPSNGLWFINRARSGVADLQKRSKSYASMKSFYNCERFLQTCYSTVKRNDERLRKINSLVHRTKMAEGEVPLPLPQVLAVKEKIELPIELPKTVTNQ
ncbi:unnamed protein product [Phytomonas sp. EM1]|nr:unnamed protein product [Phytomonas sp. EM1]|eukprot:CCW64320.1 unnamed protein product [Phytomonas sp. isolate EM1]